VETKLKEKKFPSSGRGGNQGSLHGNGGEWFDEGPKIAEGANREKDKSVEGESEVGGGFKAPF